MDLIWKAIVWLDRWVNDKLLRGRWETISSRCYRRIWTQDCKVCGWLCTQLAKIDPMHCQKSYLSDIVKNPRIPRID